jgi:hypothetical protein
VNSSACAIEKLTFGKHPGHLRGHEFWRMTAMFAFSRPPFEIGRMASMYNAR